MQPNHILHLTTSAVRRDAVAHERVSILYSFIPHLTVIGKLVCAGPSCVLYFFNSQKVSHEEAQAVADEFCIKYFETSAKNDTEVAASLEFLANHVVEKLEQHPELYEDYKLTMF